MSLRHRVRNNIGFWILGLCNNFAYVIMLSAAVDMLSHDYDSGKSKTENDEGKCNAMSSGAILVADILPALIIKLSAPFFNLGTTLKVIICVILSGSSFLLTAFSVSQAMMFTGVVAASLSSGLGEVTFLQFTSLFEPNVISFWSSGTGGAGLFGSFMYALLTTAGLTSRTTLLLMLTVPVLMAITFWCIIITPVDDREGRPLTVRVTLSPAHVEDISVEEEVKSSQPLTFSTKISLIKPLLKYMIPLGLVYYFEYFINQGLFELIYFRNTFLNQKQQYRWYQTIYQTGVLISRSSVNLVKIEKLWLLPVLQGFNVVLLLTEVLHPYLSSLILVFVIILYEGLLGGAAYVNTFYQISVKTLPQHREFSMGITSLADSLGITFAGATAVPLHDHLCKYLSLR